MSLEDGINVMRRKPDLGRVWMQGQYHPQERGD